MKRGTLPAFEYWWTRQEWARDERTGTLAVVMEKGNIWTWRVVMPAGNRIEGNSKNQKGARAACRRVVRKIP